MAQTKGLVKILQVKIANITSEKDQLHGVLDDYVHRMTREAREMLEKEDKDVNTLNEINQTMDTVWRYLVDMTSQMEDVPSATSAEAPEQVLTQTPSSSSLSSSSTQPSSGRLPSKPYDAESQGNSKLLNRMEVLEMALTTCRNEISQANTDKNEVRDKLDKLENCIQKVETSHSHELEQKEERLTSLEKLTKQTQSNMTKEIKDLQKTFKDNIKRTKLELDTKLDSVDEKFQKTQEQNVATIKEQASKLGEVEKKLKKMKEEEQERWSQIDNIHTDVESLKDDQRDNRQLVKIQDLEKHVETLTSQYDSLQDQVGKLEISTQATDEQVQELIQTPTATSRSLEELKSKVEDTERSVRGCVAQRERDENRRREMEDRVAVLEAQRQKDLDHYTKELEETNSLYKAVCQLVDQRVTPLRRLQRMLNDYHKQVEKREEISTRLDDVVKKVEDISTQLDKHERSVLPARVGFTAYHCGGFVPKKGYHITDFTDVLCNEGNHYDSSSGEFICPVDGLYVVSTTLRQNGDGVVSVEIKRQCNTSTPPTEVRRAPTEVCRAYTNQDKTSCCGVAVVRLTHGDRVYVEVWYKTDYPELTEYSSFSCFQIG